MKRDVQQIVDILTSDFFSPAGAIPVERLIRKRLRLFDDLRERGLTWEQVSRLLAGAGIVRQDGRAFSPSHLRGVFGRQRKRLALNKRMQLTIGGGRSANLALSPPRGVPPVVGDLADAGPPYRASAEAGAERREAATAPRARAAGANAGDRGIGEPASRKVSHDHGGAAPGDALASPDAPDVPPARNRVAILSRLRQSAAARRPTR